MYVQSGSLGGVRSLMSTNASSMSYSAVVLQRLVEREERSRDRDVIAAGAAAMRAVAARINEMKARHEQMVRTQEISSVLHDWHGPDLSTVGHLLLEVFVSGFVYSFNCSNTQPFNGPLSGTTRVSRYQKGKTNLDFTEARDSEWQWNQLDHMQVCTSLQTDNHARTPTLSFLQAGCPSCRPTNSVKALKATSF